MPRDRGSVLMLMPAAVLVLVVLGAVAVDFSIAFLGERELANAASAAANDAAAAAIDEPLFRETGRVVLDCGRANEVAQASFKLFQSRARMKGVVCWSIPAYPPRPTNRRPTP